MKVLPLLEVVAAINGRIVRGVVDRTVNKSTKRSDNLSENCLYFALSGPPAAVAIPAGCTVVTDDPDWSCAFGDITTIYVPSVQQAIDNFMVLYRSLFDIPVIGVTGTSGKTLTKEMIKFILQDYSIQATCFSNNGLSLNLDYLLGIHEATQAAVFEMSLAYPGSLAACCRCFQPTICIIMNIGNDGFLGRQSVDHYCQSPGKLLEFLTRCPTLIINGDDKNLNCLDLAQYGGTLIRFGTTSHCDLQATDIHPAAGGINSTIHYGNETQNLFIPCHDRLHIYNALAATAAAAAAGLAIDWQSAAARLAHFQYTNAKNT